MTLLNISQNMSSWKLFPDIQTRISDGLVPIMAIGWTVVIKLHIRQIVNSEVK